MLLVGQLQKCLTTESHRLRSHKDHNDDFRITIEFPNHNRCLQKVRFVVALPKGIKVPNGVSVLLQRIVIHLIVEIDDFHILFKYPRSD